MQWMNGASQVALVVKNPPVNAGAERLELDPLVRKIPWSRRWQPTPACWKIPQTEDPGGLQSMGPQRVGHDRVTEHTHAMQDG